MHRLLRFALLSLLGLLPLAVGGCGGDEGPYTITDVRTVDRVPPRERMRMTSAERFDLDEQPAPRTRKPSYSWTKPDGWTQVAVQPMQMRDASFDAKGADVSLLVGRPSDVLANVNRWREQMGEGEVDLAALDAMRFADGVLVDMTGTYTPRMGGGKEDHRFLGYLHLAPDHLLSVRMLGPNDAVTAQADAFRAFVESLELSNEPAPKQPNTPPPMAADDLRSKITWNTPSGWTVTRHDAGTRIASFKIDGAPKLDIPLSEMLGDGGGLSANLQMWASTVGSTPPSQSEIDALERFELLGGEAVFVDLRGKKQMGEGEAVDTALFGLVCFLDNRAIFLRLQGLASDVDKHRDAFLALGRSLRMEG